MPSELDVYVGRARRRCPDCGVEIEIQRPTRVLGRDSTSSWRRTFRKEVARQIMFEVCCESCRAFWNDVLRKIQDGPARDLDEKPAIERQR